jgi:tRNA 5-methylaminomethyl-2-thiouridine biosynthesis bifunctional protein
LRGHDICYFILCFSFERLSYIWVAMGDVPRSEMFGDVYFSAENGAAETEHVFLNGNSLPAAWQGRAHFTIAETGFGTGLNFLMAWELFERTAPEGAALDYISVEKFPLSAGDIRKALSPWAGRLGARMDDFLARYPIAVPGYHRIVLSPRICLTLIIGDVNDVLAEVEACVDAWFLDGFTPAKNPDMWTDGLFSNMARLSAPGATFATFTAAGFVKRGLRAAGFHVEKRKGFGAKRDMIAGFYKSEKSPLLSPRTRGEEGKGSRTRGQVVHILGAGLAGCAAAYVLKQYGFAPVLHDPNGVASGASGNPVGLINPRFSAFRTADSDFYTAAFALAARTFPAFHDSGYQKCGALHLITNEDKEQRLTRTAENWGWDHAHIRIVDAQAASDIAGIPIEHHALYLADSARINPAALCRAYAQGVEFIASDYTPKENDIVIDARGAAIAGDYGLPIHTVRGQITLVAPNAVSAALRTNLCYSGYISAAFEGTHCVGSTFQKWLSDTMQRPEDDADNLANLAAAVPALGDFEIRGARAALRTASRDRFPIIGTIAPNRFISSAHGSHGIVSSLAAAHLLADLVRGGARSLSAPSLAALSPARFIKPA